MKRVKLRSQCSGPENMVLQHSKSYVESAYVDSMIIIMPSQNGMLNIILNETLHTNIQFSPYLFTLSCYFVGLFYD